MQQSQRDVTIGGIVQKANAPLPEAAKPVVEKVWSTPSRPAEVGEVVLLAIGGGVLRPLLVVDSELSGKVSGIIFLHPTKDRVATWVRKYSFSQPTNATPFTMVLDIRWGEEEGQWRYTVNSMLNTKSAPRLTPLLISTGLQTGDPRMTDQD